MKLNMEIMKISRLIWLAGFSCVLFSCERNPPVSENAIKPKVITELAKHDTDDPAIWINEINPDSSLIIGTDKDEDGALMVYNLDGKIIESKCVYGIKRPNNVDIRKMKLGDSLISIAVTTERLTNKLRIFSLPDMKPVDNGGIEVFVGEVERDPMGIALYRRESDSTLFAIVGRKTGPSGKYLWQYKLEDDGSGNVKATKVREFGQYSAKKEIESIAVDDELGYLYCSDEQFGVRKYFADPEKGNKELAQFATTGFAGDHEGISIYKVDSVSGYILLSDQQANKFHIYTREGTAANPHEHKELKIIDVSAVESDGSEVTNVATTKFPAGLFVVMSTDRTFHFYDWNDIIGKDLTKAAQ
jgi:3-phytase